MAFTVSLRVGDTSTYDIVLNSAGVTLLDTPWLNAPEVDQTQLASLGDGNSLSVPSWGNVEEPIRLHIEETTPALAAAKIQALERLIDLARQGSMGMLGDKVYLRIQFGYDTLVWRSQILAGSVEVDGAINQVWRNKADVTLHLTRRFYFETEDLQPIAVSSGPTPTATTGYATVYNADNSHGTNRNWFQVAAAQVLGSLPAPAKISIKALSVSAFASIHLGNYVFADPTVIEPVFRLEDTTGSSSTINTSDTTMGYWNLTGHTLVPSLHGQFGRFVVAWANAPSSTSRQRVALQYRFPAPALDLSLGEFMMFPAGDRVVDLGALPIPPTAYQTGMGKNIYLAVLAKADVSNSATIDWLQIFPNGAGLYRVLRGPINMSLAIGDEIVDDGPGAAAYLLDAGSPIPLIHPYFEPLSLFPNRINRLRMVIGGLLDFEPGVAWGVKIETRFRRISF